MRGANIFVTSTLENLNNIGKFSYIASICFGLCKGTLSNSFISGLLFLYVMPLWKDKDYASLHLTRWMTNNTSGVGKWSK